MGELYLALGDNAKAIAAYRRALELDPGNINAAAILKKL
jgi:cytochrome c-type biogenesis protein CcmH/NrfG